jgi:hypothetical protein
VPRSSNTAADTDRRRRRRHGEPAQLNPLDAIIAAAIKRTQDRGVRGWLEALHMRGELVQGRDGVRD